jgi:hypothetical protein
MSRSGVYADWQVCLDLFMPTNTAISDCWSAADIVSEALPALSFLCYAQYDQSLDLVDYTVGLENSNGHPSVPFRTFHPKQKRAKKTLVKRRAHYKLRSLPRKSK